MSWQLYKRMQERSMTRENSDGGGGSGATADDQGGAAGDGGADDTGGDTGETGDGGGQGDEPTYESLTAQAKEIADKAEELRVSKLTDEEKAAEAKAKEDADAAAKLDHAPEEYSDFKMPKDTPVDEQLLNDFKPLAKELDLPQDKAQKLIDLYAEKVAPLMIQRQQDLWQETQKQWVETAKADKEIGGDKWDATVESAMRVVNTIGTPELKDAFNTYGLGNHPELIRMCARIAPLLGEAKRIDGNPTQTNAAVMPSAALWPNLPTK